MRITEINSEIIMFKKSEGLPSLSGVYFLISNENVVYVGKSCNINRRVKNHKGLGLIQFEEVGYVLSAEIDDLEKKYIHLFQPEFNKACKPSLLSERILSFFEERPCLLISAIESEADLGQSTLSKVVNGRRILTQEALEKILPIIRNYGWED